MLTKEQADKTKEQLMAQLDKSDVPNKEEIKASIKGMNPTEFEEFLVQNKLLAKEGEQKCIFCSIADKEMPSAILEENNEAIAILEINPVSKGHAIIIPKAHSDKIPAGATELAKQIAELLKALNPKKIDIYPSNLFGHEILNVIPSFKGETLESPRKKTTPEDLQKILKELQSVEKPKEKKPKKPRQKRITDKNTWLPKRIP